MLYKLSLRDEFKGDIQFARLFVLFVGGDKTAELPLY